MFLLDSNLSLDRSLEVVPDEDLRTRIVNYLIGRQIPGAKSLFIRAENGIVTLAGKVNSFYYKQLCTHSCRRVAGVVSLIDQIEVESCPRSGPPKYHSDDD